jgi:hypothetical protein
LRSEARFKKVTSSSFDAGLKRRGRSNWIGTVPPKRVSRSPTTVILPREDRELWLDPDFQVKEQLLALLHRYADDEMVASPVGTVVNSPKHESPQCIVPLNGSSD